MKKNKDGQNEKKKIKWGKVVSFVVLVTMLVSTFATAFQFIN